MCATMIVNESEQEKWNIVQAARYKKIADNEVRVEEYMTDDAEYLITAYGTSARVAKSAIRILREKGIKQADSGITRCLPVLLPVSGACTGIDSIDRNREHRVFSIQLLVAVILRERHIHFYSLPRMMADELLLKIIDVLS